MGRRRGAANGAKAANSSRSHTLKRGAISGVKGSGVVWAGVKDRQAASYNIRAVPCRTLSPASPHVANQALPHAVLVDDIWRAAWTRRCATMAGTQAWLRCGLQATGLDIFAATATLSAGAAYREQAGTTPPTFLALTRYSRTRLEASGGVPAFPASLSMGRRSSTSQAFRSNQG